MRTNESGNGRLMTQSELAELKNKLELPNQVLEFLRSQPRLTARSDAVTIITLLIAFNGLAAILSVSPLAVWIFSDYGRWLADAGFLPGDTLLFEQSSGAMIIALVAGGFAGLFLAYYLYRVFTRLSPSLYYKSLASVLHPTIAFRATTGPKYEGPILGFAKWLLSGIGRKLPPKEYLKRCERRYAAVWGRCALVLYLIAAGLIVLDVNSITGVTPDGVALSSDFGIGVTKYQWQDVAGIGTACVTRKGRRRKSHAVGYYLKFGDGRTVNLAPFKPLNMTWLDALETVDFKLAAFGVPKGEVEFDQDCLETKRRRYGGDFERLKRILRPAAE